MPKPKLDETPEAARILAALDAAGDTGLTLDEAVAASNVKRPAVRTIIRHLVMHKVVCLLRFADGTTIERLDRTGRKLASVFRLNRPTKEFRP